MSAITLRYCLPVLAATLAVSGCSNPEESAAAAAADAGEEWTRAVSQTSPPARLRAYDEVIASLDELIDDYPETTTGQALIAGRTVGNVSISSMRAVRDALAPRAECYSRPTADCLRAFSSQSFRGAAAAGSAEQVFANAQALVCERGFAAADAALESFKINRPVYAQQLVQLAFAAEECDKPAEVLAAINAWKAAEPSTGANRVSEMLSILVTGEFRPAWPSVLADLEGLSRTSGLDRGSAASVALTMATSYAALGNVDAAMTQYRYFTDTLNYQADFESARQLGAGLLLAGSAENAIAVMGDSRPYISSMFYAAADKLAGQLRLQDEGGSTPRLFGFNSVAEYFAPPAAGRQEAAAAAARLEAALDAWAPTTTLQDGAGTIDRAYAILAMVHQKLGASDRALACVAKAENMLDRILGQGGRSTIADYTSLVRLANGQIDEALALVPAISVKLYPVRLMLREVAATGNVERALTTLGQLGNIVGNEGPTLVIQTLIGMGELDKAEQVINAYVGNAFEKSNLHWQIVTQAANEGQPDRAEALAGKYALLNQPTDRLRLLHVFLNSEEVAGSRRRAEPIIREIFEIGEQLDRAAGAGNFLERSTTFNAQEAVTHAFRNGYTDLGIELYGAATNTNQTPLFSAFNDKLDRDDLPDLLMLAQDRLNGEPLGYVVDAAIRYLESGV